MFDINKISFEEIPSQIVEIGEKLAESIAHFKFLESMSAVTLARCSTRCEGSEAQKKRLGLIDKEYEAHLAVVESAEQEVNKYRAYSNALQARQEWFRSMNSLRKAEMNL